AGIIARRMRVRAPNLPLRIDMIGVASVFHGFADADLPPAEDDHVQDVRLRFATEAPGAEEAELLLDEVEALYCAGPAGGGGVRRHLTGRFKSASCLVEGDRVSPRARLFSRDEDAANQRHEVLQ